MTLFIKRDGHILEVKQVTYSCTQTFREFWYYDLDKWLVSSHGREGDVPDRKMGPCEVEWVRKHYLPAAS